MDVRDVGVALWRQRLLAVLVLLVTGAGVAAGIALAPRTFEATATLSAAAGPDAGALAGGTAELDSLRATLAELADDRAVLEQARDRLDPAVARSRSVDQLRQEVRGAWLRDTVLVEVSVRDRDPEVAAAVADAVVAVLAEGSLTENGTAGAVDAAVDGALALVAGDPAEPPTSSVEPDVPLVAAVGALVAVGLAVAGAVLRERRTHTADDAVTVEEAAGAPLLAHLTPPRDLTAMPALHPGTAEADLFRHLRVALEGAGPQASRVVIAAITAGDVNVWIGANVAIALAGTGRSVLLVDGRMGERFGTAADAPDTPGLYDVLLGAELEDALSPGPVERLRVLPPGTGGARPVAELLSQRFAAVMERAAQDYDHVVVLGPPLDEVEDSRVMAVDAAFVLALVEGSVSATALGGYADRVRAVGADLLGVVLVGRGPGTAATRSVPSERTVTP